MSPLAQLKQHHSHLTKRFAIIRAIREFFWSRSFLEVETNYISDKAVTDVYVESIEVTLHNERRERFRGYLHTSPEMTIKKMLATGFKDVFFLGKCFRDFEPFGGRHNPEFTLCEWYRVGRDFYAIMDDVEALIGELSKQFSHRAIAFERVRMKDLWREYVGVDLDNYVEWQAMYELCVARGFQPADNECYGDLFHRIFVHDIEPRLQGRGALIVHHYPKHLAALARLSSDPPGYAERFEVYIDGMEIANAFSELTDAAEQQKRFAEDQKFRKAMHKKVHDLDHDFIAAVGQLPDCAGIALGVDRLVQVLLGIEKIDAVIVLPAGEVFGNND